MLHYDIKLTLIFASPCFAPSNCKNKGYRSSINDPNRRKLSSSCSSSPKTTSEVMNAQQKPNNSDNKYLYSSNKGFSNYYHPRKWTLWSKLRVLLTLLLKPCLSFFHFQIKMKWFLLF